MKHPTRRWTLAVFLACAFAPTTAIAQWTDSLYLSLSGLYLLPVEISSVGEIEGNGQTSTFRSDLEHDAGMGLLVAVGSGEDVGLRGELEFGYRKLDWDKFKDFEGVEDANGDTTTLSFMANGIYAFQASDRIRPYFGAGLGLARHTITDDDVDEDDSDTVFAYQGMVGVGFPLSEKTEARVGYRYFATADAFDEFEASYDSHSIEAGIRFRF